MSRFRILIVDDEPLSRTRLRRMIALDPDCDLVAECENGAEAVKKHAELRPDLIFLDVQMPVMDGFEFLRAIAGSPALVILTSAHGEHALRAFEADVFDYLLKPFGRRRFYESLQRAKARLMRDRAGAAESNARVLPPRPSPDRIAVQNRESVLLVKVAEID